MGSVVVEEGGRGLVLGRELWTGVELLGLHGTRAGAATAPRK